MDKRLDLLNREEFVGNVIRIVNQLSDMRKGCCFTIEGSWGVGKTFVIEMIKEELMLIQAEKTNTDRYFIFHYNCWQYDYYEEPAIAIISAMLQSIKADETLVSENVEGTIKAGYEFVGEELKKIAGLYIENRIGVNLISWAESIRHIHKENKDTEYEFDQLFSFGQTIEKVRKKLEDIADERTIVLFVDELDRCIPQYAIKVLERVHHIFYGLKNIVVIVATDRKQLEHSVKEMFGARENESSIDIDKYLKKFIDFSVELSNGIINKSYWEKYKSYFNKFTVGGWGYYEKEINKIIPALFMGIDIRQQEKIMEKANTVHSIICDDKVDISVLIFEVMYEILRIWKIKDMGSLIVLWSNSREQWRGVIEEGGIKMIRACARIMNDENRYVVGKQWGEEEYKNIMELVLSFFVNIFNKNDEGYKKKIVKRIEDVRMIKYNDCLKIAEKYCDFCEIIK